MQPSTRSFISPRQFRYNEEADITLLRETLAVNPYNKKLGFGWSEVVANLKVTEMFPVTLTARAAKDRANLLLEKYKKGRRENEGSSGSEEFSYFGEKQILLEELLSLKEETQKVSSAATASANKDKDKEFKGEQTTETIGSSSQSQVTIEIKPETSQDSCQGSPPPLRLGKRRHVPDEDELWHYLRLKEENRRLELEFMRERDERDREERRREAERQRERDEIERDERKQLMQLVIASINKK